MFGDYLYLFKGIPLEVAHGIGKLAEMGISCERRTLTKDIAVLNDQGYEVMWNWVGKEKGYYIEDRSFSVPELKILIDAVQAAGFITDKKTAELIDKIADLGGSHRAGIMKSNMVCFNTRKHSNCNVTDRGSRTEKNGTSRHHRCAAVPISQFGNVVFAVCDS